MAAGNIWDMSGPEEVLISDSERILWWTKAAIGACEVAITALASTFAYGAIEAVYARAWTILALSIVCTVWISSYLLLLESARRVVLRDLEVVRLEKCYNLPCQR